MVLYIRYIIQEYDFMIYKSLYKNMTLWYINNMYKCVLNHDAVSKL